VFSVQPSTQVAGVPLSPFVKVSAVDAQGNTALQGCAANGGKYIYAADSSALNKAFQEIANELNQVRLSR
jgi:hypothetical protein